MKNLPLRRLASLLFLIGGLVAAVVLVQKSQDLREKAFHPQPTGILKNLELSVYCNDNDGNCYMSALAYDTNGYPFFNSPLITYEWGISTDGAGKADLFHTEGEVSGFKKGAVGTGDIWVMARQGDKTVRKSFRVERGVPVFDYAVPPSPEPPPQKGFCGDGICQDVACLGLDCPAPETPKNCPQDCGKSIPSPIPLPPEKSVRLEWEAPDKAKAGKLFPVKVIIDTKNWKVTAAEVRINFPANLLEGESVAAGDLPVVLEEPHIDKSGFITFTLGAQPQKTLSGVGSIAVINFKAKKAGDARISFLPTQVSAVGYNGNVAWSFGSTTVKIEEGLRGDLDGDGDVDIFDYNLIVSHFGPRMPASGTPADIDRDGDVDIFDYNILVGNFGKKTQAGPASPPPTFCVQKDWVRQKEWVRPDGTRPTGTTTNCYLRLFEQASCQGKLLGYGYCQACSADGSGTCTQLLSPTSFTFRSADLQYGMERACTDPGWQQSGGGVFENAVPLVWDCPR